MTLYQKFKKLNIDHAAIGLNPDHSGVTYFCTPKGARIIGSAGVDGIHYCFVRGQGEMVFAVSPMNPPGENVFPIAEDFEELLRLLMACGSMAAIEQAHQWDEEQFAEFVEMNPPSREAQEVFAVLKEKLGIEAVKEPFRYLRSLQDHYNYAMLSFSDEYYECLENSAKDERPVEWKVTIEGVFHPKRGKAGKEIKIGKQFQWGDELWHVPAVYLFSDGLVVDFCAEINAERMRAFYEKVKPIEEKGSCLTSDEELILRNENPLGIHFWPEINLNGEILRNKRGTGTNWISKELLDDDRWEERDSLQSLEHYGLDVSKAWMIRRCTFPWEGKRDIEISNLKLRMVRDKTDIPGVRFQTPVVGESVKMVHPVTAKEYILTVQEYEAQEMEEKFFQDNELEFPRHHAVMTYTIFPDLPNSAYMLKDCSEGDSPRRKMPDPNGRYGASVCAVGVIGGADGPTRIYYANGGQAKARVASSSLHFEPIKEPVEWQMIFREKMMEDVEVVLM